MHTGPDETQMTSTVIFRQDKGPLASFSADASSWERKVSLLVSACVVFARGQFCLREDYTILLHCCLMGCLMSVYLHVHLFLEYVCVCARVGLLARLTYIGGPLQLW